MYCIIVVLYNYYCRHCIFLFVTLFESLYCISCGSKVIHEIIARKRDRDLKIRGEPGNALRGSSLLCCACRVERATLTQNVGI